MTTLKQQMAADLDVFFNADEFADEIVYSSQISGSRAILAVIEFEENYDEPSRHVRALGRMTLKASDIQSPAYRDTFSLDETIYTIRRILSGDGDTWTLEFERDVRPTFERKYA